MRIISGVHRGRKFYPPAHIPARPTTDIAKEGLFNIIENNLDIPSLKTLDIFAGTGSISYELASRGARDLTLVEQDRVTVNFIKKTIADLHFQHCKIVKMEVFKFIRQCKDQFDFIFAGPPYALKEIDEIPELVFDKELLLTGGWLVLEHTPRNNYSRFPYYRTERNYGTTVFSIFVNREPS
jgi:16S rRNA (guanine966-N2)-methyltransferase